VALLLALIGVPIAIVLLLSYATRARRNSLLGAHGRSAYGHIAELGSESNDMGSTLLLGQGAVRQRRRVYHIKSGNLP
jgi:hypothetical protein